MKILVTGSSGFLGSWACRILSRNHKVVGLSRENSNTYRLQGIQNLMSIKKLTNEWPKTIMNEKPDVIIFLHWSGVENQYRNEATQNSNLFFFRQLCETAVAAKVSKIIGIGSQAELGPNLEPISDQQSDNPTTEYGAAKVECRKLGFEICNNSKSDFIWGRVISTYGPLDSKSWLIPSAIISLSDSKKFKSTLGEQEWSFLHALDFTLALSKLVENYTEQKIFNIGNPHTLKVNHLLRKIEALLGKSNLVELGAIPYRFDQVMRLQPKCEGLLAMGWNPIVSIDEGLKQTINWFTSRPEFPLKTTSNGLEFFNLPDMPLQH